MLLGLTAAVFASNTLLNASVLRMLGRSTATSLYVGSMLAQVGEFSFVLAAVGRSVGLVSDYAYQMTVAFVAITLVVSPAWVLMFRHIHTVRASLRFLGRGTTRRPPSDSGVEILPRGGDSPAHPTPALAH